MKKFTLLSAVLVAGMASAQVEMPTLNMEARQMITTQSIEMDREVTMEEWNAEYIAKQQKAAAADYADHDYYFTDGMLHGGVTPQFYSVMPLILLPYQDSIVWENYYGPTNWYSQASDALLAENSETLTYKAWEDYILGGMYYLMYTTDHTLTQDDKTYNIKGYYYGESAGKGGGAYATGYGPITISNGENIPMTLCGMETSMMNNESGSDFYRISAGVRGAYAYGTDLIADTATGVTADTILSLVRNVSLMKISAISIPVYNTNGTAIMPEGGEVKIELLAADLTQGIIYTDSILGTAVATAETFLDVQTGLGTIVATFQEEDPFGGMMDVSILVEGDFVTRLTGYNESGCDFGIYADYYTPGSTTLYQVNGKYTPIFSASSNLAIGYDAYWPNLTPDALTDEVTAPVEGGIAYYGEEVEDNYVILITNVTDGEAYSFDIPEWVTIEPQLLNVGSEDNVIPGLVFQVTAEPLTDGAGRQGVITINADGYVYQLTVNQGDITSGVENVVAPMFDNKIFNLLGVEVDETYKGIVIKNGQKYIQ